MLFIKVLSQRCLMLNEKIYQFSLQDVISRLAGFLFKYIEDNNYISEAEKGEPFELKVPKNEIATTIGTVSETLSRNFQKLHQMGVLKVFGKTAIVQDYAKLQELAGD
jgi:CRP/FNR family transcriptional regulator